MAEITASLVKELRDRTGAGMLDCKKALSENNGDLEASIDYLRQKGLSKAEKKAGRVTAEGLVSIATADNSAVVVEVNAETDFVARNEQFQNFVGDVTNIALNNKLNDVDSLLASDMNGKSVKDTLTSLVATVGENMTIRRVKTLSVDNGVVAGYMHSAIVPNKGSIGVLVALNSTASDKAALTDLGRKIAMHIAATNPAALNVDSLDEAIIAREKAIHAEKARESGKPENIIEKMIEGSMRKYYEQVVLLEQTFVIDGETKISAVLTKASKDLGAPVEISSFARFELGEGIEKVQENFADEVNKVVNGN